MQQQGGEARQPAAAPGHTSLAGPPRVTPSFTGLPPAKRLRCHRGCSDVTVPCWGFCTSHKLPVGVRRNGDPHSEGTNAPLKSFKAGLVLEMMQMPPWHDHDPKIFQHCVKDGGWRRCESASSHLRKGFRRKIALMSGL